METKNLLKSLKRRLGLITTVLAMLLISQGAFAAYTWSVVGLGNDWSKDYELKNISGNYYAADISVSATTEFKIRKDQAWSTSYGGAQITTSSNFNVDNSGGNNAKITISSSGTYKFIWNSSTKKLTVIYPSPKLNIKQSSSSWTQPSLTYSSTTKKYSGQVTISSIYNSGVVQVKNADKYVGNSGSATMQRDNCSGWDFTTDGKQTGINFDVPGTYTFNFDPYAGTMSVTYPYVVFGNFDGNGNKAYPLDSDGKATIKITAGNRTFRMATDKWRGCSQCSITRSNCTNIQQYDSDDKDTPINADVTGDYEFTYNLSTCKVTVKYPTACTPPTIDTHPSTTGATYCPGVAATALSVEASGTVDSYQWYSYTNAACTTGETKITSATSSSYTPSTATVGTLYYKCKVTGCNTTVTSDASGAIKVKGVTINQSGDLYEYNPITFTASDIATWSLDTGSETAYISATSGISTVLKAKAGTYTVTGAKDGCNTQKQVTIVAWPDKCKQ